jgi:hypothetical protein
VTAAGYGQSGDAVVKENVFTLLPVQSRTS